MIGPLAAGLAAIVLAVGLILFVWLRVRQLEKIDDFTGETEREP